MQPIKITEIRVSPIKDPKPGNMVLAFARVVLNGAFALTGIRIVNGKFGLFVSFPREYNKTEGKGYNIAYPISKPVQEYFSKTILDEYKLVADQAARGE